MIDGWKKVQVQDICTKGSSNIAQNKIEDNNGDYPLYGASGFLKCIDFYHQETPYIGIVKDGSGVGRVGFTLQNPLFWGHYNTSCRNRDLIFALLAMR